MGFRIMSTHPSILRLVTHLEGVHRFSPKAIINTVFGDLILPHGGFHLARKPGGIGFAVRHQKPRTPEPRYSAWVTRDGSKFPGRKVQLLHDVRRGSARDYVTPVYGVPNESWTNDADRHHCDGGPAKQAYTKLRRALIWRCWSTVPTSSSSPQLTRNVSRHVADGFKLDNRVQEADRPD